MNLFSKDEVDNIDLDIVRYVRTKTSGKILSILDSKKNYPEYFKKGNMYVVALEGTELNVSKILSIGFKLEYGSHWIGVEFLDIRDYNNFVIDILKDETLCNFDGMNIN